MFGVIVVFVAGTLAAVLLIIRPFHHGQPAAAALPTSSPATARQSPTSAATSPSPSLPAQEQAAKGLAGLLSQSVADRSSIDQAYNDVQRCGPNLSQDAQAFQSAAASRQNLLGQLANLSGRAALPANMLATLTSAWQNSSQADKDFAQWAQDEVSHACIQNDQSDPGVQAAVGPDNQATTDKHNFVSQWNPIATQYGLTTYQWNQL